jgi:hypothetical protein
MVTRFRRLVKRPGDYARLAVKFATQGLRRNIHIAAQCHRRRCKSSESVQNQCYYGGLVAWHVACDRGLCNAERSSRPLLKCNIAVAGDGLFTSST